MNTRLITSTHNLCFRAKVRMYTPVIPSFTIQTWDAKWNKLHGTSIMMTLQTYVLTKKEISTFAVFIHKIWKSMMALTVLKFNEVSK